MRGATPPTRTPASAAGPRRGRLPAAAGDERAVLGRVGRVLIGVGLADIAFMVYVVATGNAYSSSLNIFALVAGIFLKRGSLTAARICAHAAAFLAGGALVGLLALPFVIPVKLVLAASRAAPAASVLAWILALALPALSLWVYRQLTSDAVTEALDRPLPAGRSMVAGALLVLVVALLVPLSLRGGAAEQVLAEARERLGPDYEYFVSRMETRSGADGQSVSALVLAYTADRIEPVGVRCEGTGGSLRCVSRSRASASERASEGGAVPEGDASAAEEAASEPAPASESTDALQQGHESFRRGDFAAAISHYTAAIERDPSSTEAYRWRGRAYARTGESEHALADLDVCIERADADIDVYVLADRLLMPRRDWPRIIANWTAFIGRNPESGLAYLERGGAYQRNGDMEKARQDVEESCRLKHEPACQLLQRVPRRE